MESLPKVVSFINKWLSKDNPWPIYTKFTHIPLSEIEGSRGKVFRPLAVTIFINHNDPVEFCSNLEALGYPEAAASIEKRPQNLITQKANFGEIVASEFLRQKEGYQIPVYRLRYNPNPESSMKGDDILAFKFGDPDGGNREILVGEAKVRKQFGSRVVQEAYEQLCDGHRPRPKSINFIVSILRNEGRNTEANNVLGFLNKFAPNQASHQHLIFLITGNTPGDPFNSIQERDEVLENLIAVNLSVTELDEFVRALFSYQVEVDGTGRS